MGDTTQQYTATRPIVATDVVEHGRYRAEIEVRDYTADDPGLHVASVFVTGPRMVRRVVSVEPGHGRDATLSKGRHDAVSIVQALDDAYVAGMRGMGDA